MILYFCKYNKKMERDESKGLTVIAGPCSAESKEQMILTANKLSSMGIKIFRAGIWKPRTKPGGFEGAGEQGLRWLKSVKETTGMQTATEVANALHVEKALKYGVDILWIGARTTTNPFAVQEIADALKGSNVPIMVKNPVNPDLELWIGAIERFQNAGVDSVSAIHRGFSSYGKKVFRNPPMWHIPFELRRRMPNLPIICDPSHISGNAALIQAISQQAVDMGFDGLMIETHINPEAALSDKLQQITPERLKEIMETLEMRNYCLTSDSLIDLRREIDCIDEQLIEILARRMRISREIGLFKKKNAIPVLQTSRYDEIMTNRLSVAETMGINRDFMKELLEILHEESVKQQIDEIERTTHRSQGE